MIKRKKTRIKSSINYPTNLYKALRLLHSNDITGRTFNQIVIDFLYNSKEVKNVLLEIDKERNWIISITKLIVIILKYKNNKSKG